MGAMDWTKLILEISALGATQSQMAEECRCGQSTISEIGRGEIKNPGASIAFALVAMRDRLRGTKKDSKK